MEEAIASSAYPALAAPFPVEMAVMPEHECPYLPERRASLRAFWTPRMDAQVYQAFLDASFRRSGSVIYQPVCRGCRACEPIRVPVEFFRPSKSQRRCRRRNADVTALAGIPQATDEKFDLYWRYQAQRHGESRADSRTAFEGFLYRSPVDTLEFCYRNSEQQLLAVGICDISQVSLSSVYFYFDPAHRDRSLGTYGALYEIEFAARMGIPFYYLGYWVRGCRKMEYKSDFRPNEILGTDGCWRRNKEAR